MQDNKIDRQLVESARIFGQWLNQIAQTFAEDEVDLDISERESKVSQVKAKILREFETIAMEAFTPQDMLFSLSRRAGQLVQTDVPVETTFFIDAVMSGEKLSAQESLQLVITYLRLRPDDRPKYINIEPESIREVKSLER